VAVVYLVRHGQASFGKDDYDVLSATGQLQSTVVGAELRRRELKFDQVWSGTLHRQRDTATACLSAAGLDLECQVDPRWDEYDLYSLALHHRPNDQPAAMGSAQEFQRVLERAILAWSADGEPVGTAGTWREFCASGCAALAELCAGLGRGGTGLVFTSGGVIAAICANLLKLSSEGFLAINRTMTNAGITKIVHGQSGTSLVSLNEHAHFEGANRDLLSYR
jgi:broad specificity phosphatase PhoE